MELEEIEQEEQIETDKKRNTIEETLMELFFKYREALSKKEYLSIEEREKDRKKLNDLYENFQSIQQKIMDSKCYLELGNIQKEQSNRFLSDDIPPSQRIEMLAYILRALNHPVLFIHGKTTLLSSALQERQEFHDGIEILPSPPEKKEAEEECYTVSFGTEDMAKLTEGIKNLVSQYKNFSQWQKKIDTQQAELLSQMVANGEMEIVFPARKKELDGLNTAIVLKE